MTFQVDVRVNVANFGPIVRDSVVALARDIRDKSRMDIARGGHFGARFLKGLTTSVRSVEGGYRIAVNQAPGFAKVFEYGGASAGEPLLWIPARGAGTQGIRAKAYGPLFRPKGKNVLVSPRDRKVKYIGVRRITNKQRFHLRQIATDEANKFLATMGKTAGIPV